MNRINPKKLQHSKWTAVQPRNKEKHFLVTAVRCCGYTADVHSRGSAQSARNPTRLA